METDLHLSEFGLDRFEAILFDLDSTILDTGAYAIDASKWILRKTTSNWLELLDDFIIVLVERYHTEISKIASGGKFKRPIHCVRDALIAAMEEFSIEPPDNIIREGLNLFKQLHIEYSQPTEGLVEVLESLRKRNIRMGIITNTFQGNARTILTRFEIDHYFSVIADSHDYKAFKPMPEPFEFAMAELDVIPENTLYVGDEFYADVVGAVRAGLAVIWINNRGDSLKENSKRYNVEPTLTVKSFSELTRLI